MIWLRSGLLLALAYSYQPGMWHACAWGEINPNPQPAITIAAAVMLLLACVAETRG